jgi:thioredoxin reductase
MSNQNQDFDVIIIGGSYAGLSAAMALGRALRKVLIIDAGHPCNSQTPHSHNFLTRDGETPQAIADIARQQVQQYPSVTFYKGVAITGTGSSGAFTIITDSGDEFKGRKLVFATGVKDIFPAIQGISACWGISVLHCPYCHGFEVKHEKTGVLANGDMGFDYVKMISNWTKQLTLFTNGKSELSEEQSSTLKQHGIAVVETPVSSLQDKNGQVSEIVLQDKSTIPLKVMYYKPAFSQHSDIPVALGCELTEQGHLKTDMFQKTNVSGVYACGDCVSPLRSVAQAVSSGNIAGAMLNRELIEELFAHEPALNEAAGLSPR